MHPPQHTQPDIQASDRYIISLWLATDRDNELLLYMVSTETDLLDTGIKWTSDSHLKIEIDRQQ